MRPRRDAGARRGPGARGARGGRAGGAASAARGSCAPRALAGRACSCAPRGAFQRRNFALARAAARGATCAAPGSSSSEQAVREAAAATAVPGRLQVLDERPADGARRRPQPATPSRRSWSRCPRSARRAPPALVLGVLEDKDAAAMLARAAARVRSAPGSPRRPASARCRRRRCSRCARQLGFDAAVCEPRPGGARGRRAQWAREHGGGGARDRLGLPRRRAARRTGRSARR